MHKSLDKLDPAAAAEPRTILFVTNGPVTVVNADFDGDGKLDLAVLDASRHGMRLWRGDGQGGFRSESLAVREDWQPGDLAAEQLTARETEVATLVARGHTDREIASMLGIGRRTVETHTSNVRAKLGLKSRRALQHGSLQSVSAQSP